MPKFFLSRARFREIKAQLISKEKESRDARWKNRLLEEDKHELRLLLIQAQTRANEFWLQLIQMEDFVSECQSKYGMAGAPLAFLTRGSSIAEQPTHNRQDAGANPAPATSRAPRQPRVSGTYDKKRI